VTILHYPFSPAPGPLSYPHPPPLIHEIPSLIHILYGKQKRALVDTVYPPFVHMGMLKRYV